MIAGRSGTIGGIIFRCRREMVLTVFLQNSKIGHQKGESEVIEVRRRFRWDKKYLYWGITAFLVIAADLLFYTLLRYFPDVSSGLNKFMVILAPFVLGAVIAYLLTPMTRLFERILSSRRMKNALIKGKFARITAVVLSEIVLLVILVTIIIAPLIVPYSYSGMITVDGKRDKSAKNLPPFTYSKLEQQAIDNGETVFPHIFGTDELCRDYFIRVIYGARVSPKQ